MAQSFDAKKGPEVPFYQPAGIGTPNTMPSRNPLKLGEVRLNQHQACHLRSVATGEHAGQWHRQRVADQNDRSVNVQRRQQSGELIRLLETVVSGRTATKATTPTVIGERGCKGHRAFLYAIPLLEA